MKKILLTTCLFFLGLNLYADTPDYEVKSSGPFIVISEERDFPPQKIIALRKAVIISVRLQEEELIVKTSETESSYEYKDKERLKVERFITYTFLTQDEKEAKKLFDRFMSELES